MISKLQIPANTIQNIYYTLQDVSANNNIVLSGQQNVMNLPDNIGLNVSFVPKESCILTVFTSKYGSNV